jgi:flagellar basal body-associated protein FliL
MSSTVRPLRAARRTMAEKNPQDRRQALTRVGIRKEHLAELRSVSAGGRTLIIAVIVVVALVVVAGIGYFIYRSNAAGGARHSS